MAVRPVLWHIPISHYSEKARWALDYKGVVHERRAPLPGYHIAVALRLTRGHAYTFPVLELDGRAIGDSTAIIAALEERRPDPPLYPSDSEERRRALELEELFDERLGPNIRRFAFHELGKDRDAFAELAAEVAPAPLARFRRMAGAYGKAYTAVRFRTAGARPAQAAGREVLDALDCLEAELGAGEYLVGERFTVADLTAAALFYTLVLPPEGPHQFDPPASFERFRAPLLERRGLRWVAEMFRRHRRPTRSATPPSELARQA